MSEALLTDAWLYAALHGDATLLAAAPGGVHADIAPPDATYPFVTFQLESSVDLPVLNGVRIWADQVYLIKATGTAGYGPLSTIMDRVETLLHRTTATVSGGKILECLRESTIQYAETDGPVTYRHLGATYRIRTQRS